MGNLVKKLSNCKYQVIGLGTTVATVAMTAVKSSAVGESLLPTEVGTIITGFAEDLVPTALAVVAIIVPAGLSIWAIGFGVKKGISFLQKKANKAV